MKKPENKIKQYIERHGPITFENFMDFALYDKEYGYYTRNIGDIGKSGDFYTSPSVHHAFGKIISNFIVIGSEMIDSPELSIVELGSGNGYLALDILNNLEENHRKIYDKTTYYCVEISDKNIEFSQNLLRNHQNTVEFRKNIYEIDNIINGFILTNELFDSIPFHRFRIVDKKPAEIYVTNNHDQFTELVREVKDSSLQQHINAIDCEFKENEG